MKMRNYKRKVKVGWKSGPCVNAQGLSKCRDLKNSSKSRHVVQIPPLSTRFILCRRLNLFESDLFSMSKRTRSNKTSTKAVSDAAITHSIIVPAYKEKLNLRPLTTRLFTAFADSESPIPTENVELIVVDDNSRDGSVEEVDALHDEGYNVRIIV